MLVRGTLPHIVSFRPLSGGVWRPCARMSSAVSGEWKILRKISFNGHQKNSDRGFLVSPPSSAVPRVSRLLSLHTGHCSACAKSFSYIQHPLMHMCTRWYGVSNGTNVSMALLKVEGKWVSLSSSKLSSRISHNEENDFCVRFSSKFHSSKSATNFVVRLMLTSCTRITRL